MMDNSYLVMAAEASRLSELIRTQLAELEAIEAVIAIEDREAAGSSNYRSPMTSSDGLILMSPALRTAVVASTPVGPGSPPPKLQGMMSLTEGWNGSAYPTPDTVGTFFSEDEPRYEDFGMVTEDDDASSMDAANVDEMLKRSVKPSTMSKYSRLWDKWVAFADYHEVETMPLDPRGLEIFIADSAELSGSAGFANSTSSRWRGTSCLFPRPGFQRS
jgi:hypothetical protein